MEVAQLRTIGPVGLLAVTMTALPSAPAAASSITLQYSATVINSRGPIAALVPNGTPAFMEIVLDPADNRCGPFGCLANVGGFVPNSGLYYYTGSVDLLGGHYWISGYLLVNWDLSGPLPGGIDIEATTTLGPAIGPYGVIPTQSLGGFLLASGADPQLGSLPVPLLPYFRHLFDTTGGQFFVSGSDPKVVPEPGTLLLIGSGLAAVAVRQRIKRQGRPAKTEQLAGHLQS